MKLPFCEMVQLSRQQLQIKFCNFSMQDYVKHVKENVAGQGQIQMVEPSTPKNIVNRSEDSLLNPDWFPPPPSELLVSNLFLNELIDWVMSGLGRKEKQRCLL